MAQRRAARARDGWLRKDDAWPARAAPGARADCGEVVRRLERMTAGVEVEALGDREAQALFGEVPGVLQGAG